MKAFKILILLTALIPLLSCNYNRTSFIEPLDSLINAKELLSIEITSGSNPILPADGLTEIHDDQITIYLSPDINSDRDSLILDINAQGYEYFTLDNQRVESGETPVILGHDSPKTFSIHSQDGSQRDFQIRVVETLVTQLYSYDPRNTAPLQDSYYNGNVPFYLECNTSIDESSLEAGDFTLSSDYSIGTINRINENLYMLLIDSVSTVPRVDQISIELPSGAIMDDDGSENPVTNRNYSHSRQNWDSLPPAFSGSLPAELIYEGNQRMDFRLYPWNDSISTGSELKYSLYYSESSAANTTDAPAYSMADLAGQIPVHADLNISGTSREVSFTGLQDYFQYNFHLLVEDGLDNPSLYRYDHIQQAFVYVSPTGNDGLANGSINLPFRNIQPAIEYAYTAGVKQIRVSQGQYTPQGGQPLGSALKIYGDMTLSGGWNSDFTVYDPSVYVSEISGDYDNSTSVSAGDALRHFNLYNTNYAGAEPRPNENTHINGFTISYSMNNAIGGGAVLTSYPVNFKDCTFANHQTTKVGGAIYYALLGGGQTLNLVNCNFYNNSADDSGGAIAINGSGNNLYLHDSIFDGNRSEITGGAIFSQDPIIASKSLFDSNEAKTDGGALFLVDITATTSFTKSTFDDCDFVNNNALGTLGGGNGGAIYSTQILELHGSSIPQNTFQGNYATATGGAIYLEGNSVNPGLARSIIAYSLFSSNTGNSDGGALRVKGAEIEIDNSEFQNNISSGRGGAGYFSNIILHRGENLLFQGNRSKDNGGALGIYKSSSLYFLNCDFTDNGISHATTSSGGALFLQAETGNPMTVNLENCDFTNNKAAYESSPGVFSTGGLGGAIFNNGSSLTITGGTFSQNSAFAAGGAIRSQKYTTLTSFLHIDSVSFARNRSIDGNGGVVSTEGQATQIESSRFISNEAPTGIGGALYLTYPESIQFASNQFVENQSSVAGAIYLDGLSNTFSDRYSLYYGNKSSGVIAPFTIGSGAVFIDGRISSHEVNFSDCIFSQNHYTGTGDYGTGAIYVKDAFLKIYNSLFFENSTAHPNTDVPAHIIHKDDAGTGTTGSLYNSVMMNQNQANHPAFRSVNSANSDTYSNIFHNGILIPETGPGSPGPSWSAIYDLKYIDFYTTLPSLFQGNPNDDPRGMDGQWGTSDDVFIPVYSNSHTSTLINRGNTAHSSSTLDLLGANRVVDGQIDLGPYEAQGPFVDNIAPTAGILPSPLSSTNTILHWGRALDNLDCSALNSDGGQIVYYVRFMHSKPLDLLDAWNNGLQIPLGEGERLIPTEYNLSNHRVGHTFSTNPTSIGDWIFIIAEDRAGNRVLYEPSQVNS